MPKVKTNRVNYPEGWELIEPTLCELEAKMREAGNDTHDGKRKCETLWPIFKIYHQKSRYIFDLYHRRNEISKELYDFCLDEGYADKNLIAKWKKHPPLGNPELNFDGSVLSKYGSAGGFVFRDVTGKPILAAANSSPTSDILIVEALASRAGFHAAWLRGFSHREVEGDSKLLIDSLVWSHQYSFEDSNLDLEYSSPG